MQVFTLSTLSQAPDARLAVVGFPIGHSQSPRMHQAALDESGRKMNYIALEVAPGELGQALRQMRDLGFIGCNVTAPHKLAALEACDEISDTARELGAVNTIRLDPGGTFGTNTDGLGFEQAVKEALGLDLKSLAVLILGAGGGAGRALAHHCARAGASALFLVNRTVEKIFSLAEDLQKNYPGMETRAGDQERIEEFMLPLDQPHLIVNATSLGLAESDSSPFPSHYFRPGSHVFDIIYKPTLLCREARAAGIPCANGGLMLLHQGVAAFRCWFPASSPEAAMRAALAHVL